ncbi:unnamed protein product [Closterium sp. Naga37s-1]|nr:unnamed protein product [Closterium sp. Naga37s-1]
MQAVREASAIDAATAAGRPSDAAITAAGRPDQAFDQLSQLPSPREMFHENASRRSPPSPQTPRVPLQLPLQPPLQPEQESVAAPLLTRHHVARDLARSSPLSAGLTSKSPSFSTQQPSSSPVPNVTATVIAANPAPAPAPGDSAIVAAAADASLVSPFSIPARSSGVFYSPASPPQQTTTTTHISGSTAHFGGSTTHFRFTTIAHSRNRALSAPHLGDLGSSSLLLFPRSPNAAESAPLSHSTHPNLSPTSSLSTTSTTLPAVLGAALSPPPYRQATAAVLPLDLPLDLPRDLSPDLTPPPGLPPDLPPDLPSVGSAGRPIAVGALVGEAEVGRSEAEEREAEWRLCAEEMAQLKALLLDDADRGDGGGCAGTQSAPLGQCAEQAGLPGQRAEHDGSRRAVSRSNGDPPAPHPAEMFLAAAATSQGNPHQRFAVQANPQQQQQQQRQGRSQQNDIYRQYLLAELRKARASMLSRGATASLGLPEHAPSPGDQTANKRPGNAVLEKAMVLEAPSKEVVTSPGGRTVNNRPRAAVVPGKAKAATAGDVACLGVGVGGGGGRSAMVQSAMVQSAMLTPLGIVTLSPQARANSGACFPGSPFGNAGVRKEKEGEKEATGAVREATEAAREADEQELREICSLLFSAGAREADGFLQGALDGAGGKGVVGGSSGWEASGSQLLGSTSLPQQQGTLQHKLPHRTIPQQATPHHAAATHATPRHAAVPRATPHHAAVPHATPHHAAVPHATPHHTAVQHATRHHAAVPRATPQHTLIHDQVPLMVTEQETMPLQGVLAAAAFQAAAVEPFQESTLTRQEMMLLQDVLASPFATRPSASSAEFPRGTFEQPQRRAPKSEAQRSSGMAGERDLSRRNTRGAEQGAVHHTVKQLRAVVAGSSSSPSDDGLTSAAETAGEAAAAAAATGAQLFFNQSRSSTTGGGAGCGTRATCPRTTAVGASGPTVTAVGVSSVGAACIGASGDNTAALLPSMRTAEDKSLLVPTTVDRSSVESSRVSVSVPAKAFTLEDQQYHHPESSHGFGGKRVINDAGAWTLWDGNQPVWNAGDLDSVRIDGFPGFSPQPVTPPPWDGLRCLVCGSELSKDNTTAARVLPNYVGPEGLGRTLKLRVHGCNDCLGLLIPSYIRSLERETARESVAGGSRRVQGSGSETGGDANDADAPVGELREDLHMKNVGAGVEEPLQEQEAETERNRSKSHEKDVQKRGDVEALRMEIGNKEDLRVPFERYGQIKDVYLPKDYHTGEPRGFGFVQFVNMADAEDAQYELDRTNFNGREITVVFAEENRKKPDEMSTRERYSSRDRPSFGRRRGHSRSRSRSPPGRRSFSPPPRRRSRSPPPRRSGPPRRSPSYSNEDRDRSYSRSPSPRGRGRGRSPPPPRNGSAGAPRQGSEW